MPDQSREHDSKPVKKVIKNNLIWLLFGPLLALAISFISWFMINYFTPGKLLEPGTMISVYPLALLMSLLTPWGWLMYGGLLMINNQKLKIGLYCTLGGAIILGLFLPVWSIQLQGS